MKSHLIFASLLILSLLGFNLETTGQPKSESHIQTIIDGRVWVPKTSASLEEQFFLKKMKLKGSFLYKGVRFNNLEFAYDLSNEEILIAVETFEKNKSIIIVNPHCLEGFSVNYHLNTFDFLRGDLLHEKLDSQYYYQVIKSKNLQYIIKRKKHRKAKSIHSMTDKCFDENSLFLISESKLIPVKGKNDILNLFPDQKKEMKRFIRNNKLKIRTETPLDAVPLLLKFDL